MKRIFVGSMVLLLAALLVTPLPAGADAMKRRTVAAREGDNTIYLRWNADKRTITEASSSRRFTAGQELELLTSVSDRTERLTVRAVLRNISDDTIYVIRGARLLHRVFESSREIKTFRSRPIETRLRPGEKVAVRFLYMLRSGDYSLRTDLVTE